MTATIHPLHGEVQSPDRQANYFEFVHKSVMLTIATLDVSKRFAQFVIDESLRTENKYLAEEALTFINCLEKLEHGRKGR